MKSPILIRPGTPDDATYLVDLLAQLGHPLKEEEVSKKIELFGGLDYCLLVCEDQRRTVGFISLHWFDKFHSLERTGRITALCVDERVRDKGIGGLLVAAAERFLKEHDCREVEVTTNMSRSVTPGFYRKHGYEERSHHFVKSL